MDEVHLQSQPDLLDSSTSPSNGTPVEASDASLDNVLEVTAVEGTETGEPESECFGLSDSEWAESAWHNLVETLVGEQIVSWKDVATFLLGQLNPSQVGTSIASSDGFKKKYGKGKVLRKTIEWFYEQAGRCVDCGSRLDLQVDHIQPKESFADPLDADYFENLELRCRRCNVIRRPSHQLGGRTHLTAEAGLMWILFVLRPKSLRDFMQMCRLYGMTMADIRMQEAWAMAQWLARSTETDYRIANPENEAYDIFLWPGNRITKLEAGSIPPSSHAPATLVARSVGGDRHLVAISQESSGRLFQTDVPNEFIPFSDYDLSPRSPAALSFRFSAGNSKKSSPPTLLPIIPRDHTVIAVASRAKDEQAMLTLPSGSGTSAASVKPVPLQVPGTGRAYYARELKFGKRLQEVLARSKPTLQVSPPDGLSTVDVD